MGCDSVNHAGSGDIKIFIEFCWYSNLKFMLKLILSFWYNDRNSYNSCGIYCILANNLSLSFLEYDRYPPISRYLISHSQFRRFWVTKGQAFFDRMPENESGGSDKEIEETPRLTVIALFISSPIYMVVRLIFSLHAYAI